MTRHWTRRLSVACVVTGIVSVAAGAAGIATAQAEPDPGSGFGAMNLSATASGVRVPFYNTSDGKDVEGLAPYSLSEMDSGNVGHALTSVFWPGDTGGHGGSTLQLLGAQCVPPNPQGLIPGAPCLATLPQPPDQVYQALNDPEIAEAQTGTGAPTTTLSRPWATMTATATPGNVLAETTILGAKELPTGDTFGETRTTTTITLTGAKQAVVDAVSIMRNIDLGGVIKIAAITSSAHGETNGTAATGKADSVITGATIGGVPVTIDDTGVHVQGQGSSLDGLAQINDALKQSGFAIYVAKPTKTLSGAGVTVNSGSLIVTQSDPNYTSQGNATGKMFVLGETSVIADAGLAFQSSSLTLPSTSGFTPPAQPAAGSPAAPSITVPSAPSVVTAPTVAGAPAFAPVVAGKGWTLPGGLPAGYLVLVVIGGLLAAAGLRRLPDRLLAAAATPCPLGEAR